MIRLFFKSCKLPAAAAIIAFLSAAPGASAQGPLPPAFPNSPDASDVDEVEEVVSDSEVLLPDELNGDEAKGRDGSSQRVGKIKSTQDAELSYTQEEVRGRFKYGAAAAIGTAMPWQNYSLSWFKLLEPQWAVGLYVGGGQFRDSGTTDNHAFDMKIGSRSTGVEGHYYFSGFDNLSLVGTLAYAIWDGNVTPSGADDATEGEDAGDVLTSSFDASGLAVGFGAALTWLWDSGFYIDWTPVALRRSWIVQKDQSRESDFVDKVIEQKIERPFFFGVSNIRLGYLF